MAENNATLFHKYIVVGAGPGGLQAGYFLQQRRRDYVIFERAEQAASFFSKYPMCRRLNSYNKKYNYFEDDEFNMRSDWNSLLSENPDLRFTPYTDDLWPRADVVVQYLRDFAKATEQNILYSTNVTKVEKNANGNFLLTTSQGRFECEVLLLGTGPTAPFVPDDIEGIEHAVDYGDQPTDLEFYRNKRVGIIGQGNSAFETADRLLNVAAIVTVLTKRPPRFSWDTHYVGDVRAQNNNIFDMFQLKLLHGVLNPRLRRILKLPNGKVKTEHEYDYPNGNPPGTLHLTREYDIIIRCTGWKWVKPDLFAPGLVPDTWYRGKYPNLTSTWESVNVPNLYYIGGAMQGADKKTASSSGFIHGYRYNIRTLCHLLDEKYEGIQYPHQVLDPLEWNSFIEWMYKRFSNTAALNELWGFMSDALVVSKDLRSGAIYQELPIDNVRARFRDDEHVFILTLEFGFDKHTEAPLTFRGPSDPTQPELAVFLHPVIRYRHGGKEDEFHMGDSLLGRWDRVHAAGGAVMNYEAQFVAWLEAKLGRSIGVNVASVKTPFRPWSEDEILQWKKDHPEGTADAPLALRSAPGARTAASLRG
jgi:thioredoxin reductase